MNCLFCVAHGIDTLVTDFYRALHFEPWHVFANRHRDENIKNDMRDVDRQTGRTTHGLLEAIARCARERKVLGVTGRTIAGYADQLRTRLDAFNLHVPINVARAGRSDMIPYEDHYHG